MSKSLRLAFLSLQSSSTLEYSYSTRTPGFGLIQSERENSFYATPPLCKLCNRTFGSKFSYSRHMAQHQGQFSHTCDICGQGFMVKGSLENHRRSHTGERLVCVCGARFVSYQGYSQHQKKCAIHSEDITST